MKDDKEQLMIWDEGKKKYVVQKYDIYTHPNIKRVTVTGSMKRSLKGDTDKPLVPVFSGLTYVGKVDNCMVTAYKVSKKPR